MTAWTDDRVQQLKKLWPKHGMAEIADIMGVTKNAIIGKSNRLNLQYHSNGTAVELPTDHAAVTDGRSVFRRTVQDPGAAPMVLKPGWYNRKIGKTVTKGDWAGMTIYSLTLEERATCPRDCAMWRGCYGNAMGNAARMRHGHDLERLIGSELHGLAFKHRGGFVVRLHILGDFYSPAYVQQWAAWMREIPQLRVFGYTAWKPHTPIGSAIMNLRAKFWPRFMIRLSSKDPGPMRAITLAGGAPTPPDTVVCPAETKLGKSCSTCALCWSPAAERKTIAFVLHGG